MQRSHAKAVAYGLIYGKGATTLAKELGISVGEAEKVGVCGCRGWVGISLGEAAEALNIQSPLLLSSPANPAPPPACRCLKTSRSQSQEPCPGSRR